MDSIRAASLQAATVATEEEYGSKDISKMVWKEGKPCYNDVKRGAVVALENVAYFRPCDSIHVLGYQYSYKEVEGDEAWFPLPDNPNIDCGLVVIDGRLTTVGGRTDPILSYGMTNTLLSLTLDISGVRHDAAGLGGEGEMKEWVEVYPAMATARSGAACITTSTSLIVAGGYAKGGPCDIVEVMDISTKQWRTVTPLSIKLYNFSAAISGDTLYLAGGSERDKEKSKLVLSCQLLELLTSTVPRRSIASMLRRSPSPNRGRVWKEVCSLPVCYSTLVTFNGNLLALGGMSEQSNESTTVYKYDPQSDSWSVASHMIRERLWPLVVGLEGRLIVVGGVSSYLRIQPNCYLEVLGHERQ